MSTQSFEWGSVKVEVESVGPTPSSIDGRKEVMKYAVGVRVGVVSYITEAWGSIHEFERFVKEKKALSLKAAEESLDFKGIGAMVVSELFDALSDPDEFVEQVMLGAMEHKGLGKGMALLDAADKARKVVFAAARIGIYALEQAVDKIREEGLL